MERNESIDEVPLTIQERETELSELAANLQSLAESEKISLARQLHDELGGALVGAKMDLAWLRRKIGSTDADIVAHWERLERALETGIAFKRRVVEQAAPDAPGQHWVSTPPARWVTEETCAAAGLRCELELPLPEPSLSKDLGITLFRVLQESLVNVTSACRRQSTCW